MQSTMMFYEYIVKILMTIDFKYSWKHFQNVSFSSYGAEVLKNLKVRSHLTEVIQLVKFNFCDASDKLDI